MKSIIIAMSLVACAHAQPIKPLVPRGPTPPKTSRVSRPGLTAEPLASAFTNGSTRSTPGSGRIAASMRLGGGKSADCRRPTTAESRPARGGL